MFKNIIAPVQAWLLSQGRCVGCGTSLKNGRVEKISDGVQKVTCKKCSRIFLYDPLTKHYRRAPTTGSS